MGPPRKHRAMQPTIQPDYSRPFAMPISDGIASVIRSDKMRTDTPITDEQWCGIFGHKYTNGYCKHCFKDIDGKEENRN